MDMHPGDRAHACKGMMEPIAVEMRGRNYRIAHQCVACKERKIVDASFDDSLDALQAVFKQSL